MQDQDPVGISDAMSNELLSKLMLSNKRPTSYDNNGPDISYVGGSVALQHHVRTGSAPSQLDNLPGNSFFAEGAKAAFFSNAPGAASQMSYDTAGFRSGMSDDRYNSRLASQSRSWQPHDPARTGYRKHPGSVDTAKLLHHKMKPVDARGMHMGSSRDDVRSTLWLNKQSQMAAADGNSWGQQDTDDRDVPLSGSSTPTAYMLQGGLHRGLARDTMVGSCPTSSQLDAELPYFSGKSIRTNQELASLQAVSRAASYAAAPSSATSILAAETPFTHHDGLFQNSPMNTPRSPLFDMNATNMGGSSGLLEQQGTANMPAKDVLCNMGDTMPGRSDSRYKPSKLRNMSNMNNDYDGPVSTAALLGAGGPNMMQAPAAMDTFGLGADSTGQHSSANNTGSLQPTGLLEAAIAQQQQQQQHQDQQQQQQAAAAAASFAAAAAAAGMYPNAGMACPPMMGMPGAPMPTGMPGPMPMMPDASGAMNPYMNPMMAWFQAMSSMMPQLFMGFGGYPGAAAGMPPGMPPGMPYGNPAEYAAWMQRFMTAAAGGPAGMAMAMAAAAAASAGGPPGSHMDDRDSMAGGLRHGMGAGDRRRSDHRLSAAPGRRSEEPMGLGMRSDRLLEEFKNNTSGRHWVMRDILGHMLDFSLDQHGSRFIQQHLGDLSPNELSMAFHELMPKALMLMNDVFGNYVIQKVLELGPTAHRSELVAQMRGQVLHLSLQMYSCRVIQKALEVVTPREKVELVGELEGHVLRCVRDQNGNHVIQKVIECVPTRHISHLLDAVIGQLVPLAVHSFGCRVVQRILEHCDDPAHHDVVMRAILGATVQLTQDQYGNYVIQHVLEHGKEHERTAIIDQLAPHITALSQNKFASNVVEKCLLHGSPQQRVALVEGILRSEGAPVAGRAANGGSGGAGGVAGDGSWEGEGGPGGPEEAEADPLFRMMKDQFGNYVVQKVLEVCNDDQRERLLTRVRAHLWSLKKFTYGKHIVARVEKLLSAGTRIQTGQRHLNMNVGVVITPESSSSSIGSTGAGWPPVAAGQGVAVGGGSLGGTPRAAVDGSGAGAFGAGAGGAPSAAPAAGSGGEVERTAAADGASAPGAEEPQA